jgi:hypothetical protein
MPSVSIGNMKYLIAKRINKTTTPHFLPKSFEVGKNIFMSPTITNHLNNRGQLKFEKKDARRIMQNEKFVKGRQVVDAGSDLPGVFVASK